MTTPVAVTVAVTIVAAMWTVPGWVSVAIVVVVVAGLGIPHGAVDHLVVEAIDGQASARSRRRFMSRYLLAMVGTGLVWLVSPAVALAGFLLVSVHHFGQSDLAHLGLRGRRQLALQWSRGVFLVGLPLVAHPKAVAPVVERLGGGDPATWAWLVDHSWWWSALLVIQHLVVGAVSSRAVGRTVVVREAVTVAVLTALFVIADPLIGFAVYFGLWHSLAHVRVLTDVLGKVSMRSFARLAAPLTALSLVGLVAIGAAVTALDRTDLLVPALFVVVSMVTVPHLVVVERLWRRRPAAI